MSYIVARMQKMKAGNLTGIGNHNQRKTNNHTNQEIDTDKSHLNYDLLNRTDHYKTDIERFINEKRVGTRAIRKDAVLVNEWLISSDRAFFDGLTLYETEQFFRATVAYFADKFGEDNIRYATVHLDETTPHMHMGIVPFDSENKLSAKRVFNREALREVQDELPQYLKALQFDIERGRKGSEQKNLTVPEYKEMKRKQEQVEKQVVQKKEELVAYQKETKKEYPLDVTPKRERKLVDVETGEKTLFGKPKMKKEPQHTGKILLTERDYVTILEAIREGKEAEEKLAILLETDVYEENAFFKGKVESLTKEKRELLELNNKHVGMYRVLEEENSFLKGQISDLKEEIRLLYKTTRTFLKERTSDIKAFKALFSDFMRDLSEKLTSQGVDNHFEKQHEKEKKKERKQSRGLSR